MSCSGCVVLAAGTMNVAELVLAQQELGSGRVGFALLVSAYGCGLIAGSLLGAATTTARRIRRRYLGGMALMVAGLTGSALAPALGFAMVSFAITGAGDGLFILSDRVLLQRMVPGAPPRPRVRRPRLGRGVGLRRRGDRRRRARDRVRRPRHLRDRRRRDADRPDRRQPRALERPPRHRLPADPGPPMTDSDQRKEHTMGRKW